MTEYGILTAYDGSASGYDAPRPVPGVGVDSKTRFSAR